MALAAAYDLEIVQLDAVNAFLNSRIDEETLVEYPEGFKKEGKVLQLLRALYGLRQSPRLWYKDLTEALQALGLVLVPDANCLLSNKWLTVLFYVDDILFIYHARDTERFEKLLAILLQRYQMRRMKEAKWFLGIRIIRDRVTRRIWLCQDSYIDKLAAKFNIDTTRLPNSPLGDGILTPYEGEASSQDIYAYQQRIGSINFASIGTRADIARPCSVLSQFLQNPGPAHLTAADRAIGYLVGTKTKAILFDGLSTERLGAYSDASFADNKDKKSSDGYLFTLYGGPVDWKAAKQKTVSTSTTEAELLALSEAAKQAIQWERILKAINYSEPRVPIQCDNSQTIRLLTEDAPQLVTRLRHVDIHHHWLRQETQDRRILIQWCPTKDMKADGLTKTLTGQRFEHFIEQLGLDDIQDRLSQSA